MRAMVPLAEGFEEIEAVTIIDILRRAHIDVTVAGVGGMRPSGSHGISVACDAPIEACQDEHYDAIVLPGGPGTRRLRESPEIIAAVTQSALRGAIVAAICAAPIVLDACGLLKGKRATSHPDQAPEMKSCTYVEEDVVEDGNIITSRGAGTSIAFAAAVVKRLAGEDAARDILARIQYRSGA
ncbi:MAG TPA: DJ-1 family glyoxalase III [Candidatus Krumholzibacteria bacterium]|nr:DJ-1 family glyoxalase III [Candidatus Krumholzibacteria bacterium]